MKVTTAAGRPPSDTPGPARGDVGHRKFLARVLANAPDRPTPGPALAPGSTSELAYPLRPFAATAAACFLEDHGSKRAWRGVDREAVWAGAEEVLLGRLEGIAGRVLSHELARSRSARTLRGDSSRARFVHFVTRSASRTSLAGLLARYPVVADRLVAECRNTVDALVELLDRLDDDRDALASTLLAGCADTRLIGVVMGAGDRHGGGRTVAILDFADGSRVVYKPRPLGVHEAWNALLSWFRSVRPELAPRGAAVLTRSAYGWMEFVEPSPCRDRGQVESFYRRQGALLALCYLLDAVDMHCENLIACGDQPVLIDIETLFHPAWRPHTDIGDDPALAALNDSVMRTGILPWPIGGAPGGLDISAFAGGHDRQEPEAGARWLDAGTDTMRVAPMRLSSPDGANRPMLRDAPVDPLEYGESLRTGFVSAYRALIENSEWLTDPAGLLSGFAGQQTRIVVRATHVYARMLAEATSHDRVGDRSEHAAAFAGLDDVAGYGWQRSLVEQERADLMAGDVPLFAGRTDGTTVCATGGEALPVELDRTGMDRVIAKVSQLDLADLRRQQWLISASLATRSVRQRPERSPVRTVPQPLDRTTLLAVACGIGDELISTSFGDRHRVNWLGVESRDCEQWTVMQLGAGLADGYSGVALFLAELAALTGLDRYAAAAAQAARPLPRLVRTLATNPSLARDVGPGGLFGIGGVAYALARLAVLLDDGELRASVPVALDALAPTVDDVDPGIGFGVAGGLAALRAIHAETGDPGAVRLERRFADRLLGMAAGAGGFLGGAVGVRWAAGSQQADLGAIGDLSWSDGLAGAALAAGDAAGGGETVRTFLAAMRKHTPMPDQSLCHGESGLIDVLVELAGRGTTEAGRVLDIAGGRLLGAIAQRGTRCGTPTGVSTPGLLHGTAGIGYCLLRLAFGGQIPSVLAMRPG